jgi:hypothetical protein
MADSPWLGSVFALALAVGCNAKIEGPGHEAPESYGPGGSTPSGTLDGKTPEEVLNSPACRTPAPGAAPMRRLSNQEYRNTVQDLLAQVSGIAAKVREVTGGFPAEPESLGFRNAAHMLTVPSLMAQSYMDAAESLAEFVLPDASKLLPCTTEDKACATEFVTEFGKRVYRRPLSAEEVQRYQVLYDTATAEYDFDTAIEWILFSMLQATPFLHRMEFGASSSGQTTKPAAYEMASRLSYLIWQSMPDEALFSAAESGQIETPAQIEAQARRMLADPKAERLLEYFDQWLDIDSLTGLERDANVYPELPDNLPELLRDESHAFIQSLLRSPTGGMHELFTAPYTFVNAALAEHYGLPAPSGSGFQRVDAPGRSGILTQGMMLAHDRPVRTSIVRRGLKVRTDLLCQLVPAPPPDVSFDLESFGPNLTQRERLALHREGTGCVGCHSLMDPIGVAFEAFDAVGRPRTVDEQGRPIVIDAELTNTRDSDGPVADPVELGERLGQSEEVRDCYVRQAFRFFYGRDSAVADQCSMARLVISFRDSQYSLSELIVALTQADAFLYRPVVTPEAP